MLHKLSSATRDTITIAMTWPTAEALVITVPLPDGYRYELLRRCEVPAEEAPSRRSVRPSKQMTYNKFGICPNDTRERTRLVLGSAPFQANGGARA